MKRLDFFAQTWMSASSYKVTPKKKGRNGKKIIERLSDFEHFWTSKGPSFVIEVIMIRAMNTKPCCIKTSTTFGRGDVQIRKLFDIVYGRPLKTTWVLYLIRLLSLIGKKNIFLTHNISIVEMENEEKIFPNGFLRFFCHENMV